MRSTDHIGKQYTDNVRVKREDQTGRIYALHQDRIREAKAVYDN